MGHVNFVFTQNLLYGCNVNFVWRRTIFRSNPVFHCLQFLMFIGSSELNMFKPNKRSVISLGAIM